MPPEMVLELPAHVLINVTYLENRVLQMVKLRGGHGAGLCSSMTGVLIRSGNVNADMHTEDAV